MNFFTLYFFVKPSAKGFLCSEQYEELMLSKPSNTEVILVDADADAVYPEHNAQAGYAWIKRGETTEPKTISGQQRLN